MASTRTKNLEINVDIIVGGRKKAMEWERIGGNWGRFRSDIRRRWVKLSEVDLDLVAGRRERLVGKLQESYGIPRVEAELEVQRFCRSR